MDTVSEHLARGYWDPSRAPPNPGCLLPFQLEPMENSKHSSSVATASLCFSHIQELWTCLAWPDPVQAQGLGTQLSQVGTTAQEQVGVRRARCGPQLSSPCVLPGPV